MALKIKPEHYEILCDAIKRVQFSRPHFTLKYYIDNNLGKDNAMRWRWDLLWAAKQLKYLPTNFVTDTLYKYLDDTHIDSALKAITR
jgi:hypothetical protein